MGKIDKQIIIRNLIASVENYNNAQKILMEDKNLTEIEKIISQIHGGSSIMIKNREYLFDTILMLSREYLLELGDCIKSVENHFIEKSNILDNDGLDILFDIYNKTVVDKICSVLDTNNKDFNRKMGNDFANVLIQNSPERSLKDFQDAFYEIRRDYNMGKNTYMVYDVIKILTRQESNNELGCK